MRKLFDNFILGIALGVGFAAGEWVLDGLRVAYDYWRLIG